jgi:tRNA A-37 threonylcarbamoyl transferase component Bud32
MVEARVGPYRILRHIKSGGQGRVYLGYDERLHRRVAIKIYALPAERAARRRLRREAQLVAGIRSPRVVQIHDVIESGDHLAMVMEYVPGCDLAELLEVLRPSLASVLAIGTDLAAALAAARQQHLVHGDLKAGNVLIADTGRVLLTDFGIARKGGAQVAKDHGASLSALSPEQCRGAPLDVRSDLFALGCLLYRMLTGTHPFLRGGQLDTRLLLAPSREFLREGLAAAEELPAELEALVLALLQRDPGDRPGNTHQVRQVLRRVSRGIPLAATNSLLREARPCFRRDSPEEMPPRIPASLGREGRSRLAPAGPGAVIGLAWRRLWWPARGALVLAVAALAVALPLLALRGGETVVEITAPVLRVSGRVEVPPEVSDRWLVEEVRAAAGQAGRRVAGARFAGQALFAGGAGKESPSAAEERLHLALRCAAPLCVFAVRREGGAERRAEQVVLFPDMSLGEWRDGVRGAVRALYE